MKRRTALPFVVAALVVTTACSEPGRIVFPSSPTPLSIPLAHPGAPSTATPIILGQDLRATVALTDVTCDTGHGFEPCVQFALTASTSGRLWVELSSAGPSELGLRLANEVTLYSIGRMEGSANVAVGSTYVISVSLHFPKDGKLDQAFVLRSGIEP